MMLSPSYFKSTDGIGHSGHSVMVEIIIQIEENISLQCIT